MSQWPEQGSREHDKRGEGGAVSYQKPWEGEGPVAAFGRAEQSWASRSGRAEAGCCAAGGGPPALRLNAPEQGR